MSNAASLDSRTYAFDASLVETARGRPVVFFSAVPPDYAKLKAAKAMLASLSETWTIIVPGGSGIASDDRVLTLSPLHSNRHHNGMMLRRVAAGLGRSHQALFVFLPHQAARKRWPHFGYGRAARHLGLYRFAAALDARLVPVWFSQGRKSVTSEAHPLECRVGVPIVARELAFFGSKIGDGLKAALATLKTRAQPLVAAPQRFLASLTQHGAVQARVVNAAELNRADVMAFRRCSFPDDSWGQLDELSYHVVAESHGHTVGYYRLLPWHNDSVALSPIHKAYCIQPGSWDHQTVLEMGRFCVDPGPQGAAIARRLWLTLNQFVRQSGPNPLLLGLMSPNNMNPVVAAAQFEYVRRVAPCTRTAHFVPRQSLKPLGDGQNFTLRDIHYNEQPKPAMLASILRSYLQSGARFGAPTLWKALQSRPAILASIAPHDLQRKWE